MAAPRFAIITEADARQIEPGSTVELEHGGHVTPLAWDTLRARRVTVVPAGTVDPALPADLAPVTPVARVAIGADHTGLALKAALVEHLRQAGKAVTDHGTSTPDPVDYPDIAAAVGARRGAPRGRRRHRDRRRGSGIGDRRQQDPRRPRRDVHHADARAVRARAQRRQRARARRDARVAGRGSRDRRRLAVDADARGAVPAPAAEDPRGSRTGSDGHAVRRSRAAHRDRRGRSDGREPAARRRGARATPCSRTAVRRVCRASSTPAPTRLGVHAAGGAPAGVAGLIDHTLLKPDATRQEIETALPRGRGATSSRRCA